MDKQSLTNITHFLFEAGMLAKTPRSGFFFLGSGEQSVAEHLNRTAYVGFVLASMNKKADVSKVMQMCLFHDFTESRISDLNYVHQKYTERHENKALADLVGSIPFGKYIDALIKEYTARETIESKLAKDADNIEFLLSIKEQIDIGNVRGKKWIPSLLKRLKTEEAQELAKSIINTESDRWWIGDENDEWWVSRNKKN
ncbi:MAG TPA: HD domain-containing protein [Candidatus Paceibacterota bacterium]